eukprot:scaffold1026_cov272-Pinguiococcus_pyrenoidosus.AAC.14
MAFCQTTGAHASSCARENECDEIKGQQQQHQQHQQHQQQRVPRRQRDRERQASYLAARIAAPLSTGV